MIENVLASRYSCNEINSIFERTNRFRLEREFWVNVLKLQVQNGFNVPSEAIDAYEKNTAQINLESIDNREFVLKHDVKARIEEFNHLAGYEYIHIGLTSRDLTENIELFQIRESLKHIREKSLYLLILLGEKISKYKNTHYVSRTHNVPAQLSTLGKRFSVIAEELLSAIHKLDYEINSQAFRGLQGAVGTASDLKNFFSGNQIAEINRELLKKYGFEKSLQSVGQVYPRSYDFSWISTLNQLASPILNLALDFRLMAGLGFVSEGFLLTQVGSSAMPHKKNARTAERITGLGVVLKGFCNMANAISGNQWNEGDVSCSVVRRVIIPDSIFVTDGILNSSFDLIKKMFVDEISIRAETESEITHLISSKILMLSVKKGVGREKAHAILKDLTLKSAGNQKNFKQQILSNQILEIEEHEFDAILNNRDDLIGIATEQCEQIEKRIKDATSKIDLNFEISEVR